jgi:serine/threonine protein kinase
VSPWCSERERCSCVRVVRFVLCVRGLGRIVGRVLEDMGSSSSFDIWLLLCPTVIPTSCHVVVDPVLGQPVHKEISLASHGGLFQPTLQSKLLKAGSLKDPRPQVLKFSDLLGKCLIPDPSKRITVKAALQHDFFKDDLPT